MNCQPTDSFLDAVRTCRVAVQRPLRETIEDLDWTEYRAEWEALITRTHWRDPGREPGWRVAAATWIRQPFRDYFAAGEKLLQQPTSDVDVEDLHGFRIGGKRLRYALEICESAFPADACQVLARRFRRIQDRLGKINDHATALRQLEQWRACGAFQGMEARIERVGRTRGDGVDRRGPAIHGEMVQRETETAATGLANMPHSPPCSSMTCDGPDGLMNSTSHFGGLRIAAFESRRAPEMAQLIRQSQGHPFVSPSMREIPLDHNPRALEFAQQLLTGDVDVVIFMTGVGFRYLWDLLRRHFAEDRLSYSLSDIVTVARGPKPVAALKEVGLVPTYRVGEPNTWRELLQLVDEQLPVGHRTVAIQEYGESNPSLIAGLEARGALVRQVPVYTWGLPVDLEPLPGKYSCYLRW